MFNIVFFCTLVSLVVQGATLSQMAKFLGLAQAPSNVPGLKNFDVEFSDEIKSITSELKVTEKALSNGRNLMNLILP